MNTLYNEINTCNLTGESENGSEKKIQSYRPELQRKICENDALFLC